MAGELQTFEAARKFADRVHPDLSLAMESFGVFDADPSGLRALRRIGPISLGGDERNFFEYRAEPSTIVRVTLDDQNHVSCIQVKFGDEWWGVDRYEITCEPVNPELQGYPQFFMRWGVRTSELSKFGALHFVEFRAAPTREVFYSYHGSEESRVARGETVPGELGPLSLKGATDLHGRGLLWQLDAGQKIDEILRAAQWEKFLLSVPLR